MKLVRVPGKRIVADFSLAKAIAPPRADPNGYYETLGLDPRMIWSQDDIRTAFRDRAKRLHPDGSDPDPVGYDRLQVAYQVLSDPELRRKYDALDSQTLWRDKEVIAALIKKVAEARAKGVDTPDLAPMLKDALMTTTAPPGPRYDSYAYYHYEGEGVPDEATREAWTEKIMHAAWGLDKKEELRLGFTTGALHVLNKPWGQVMMASGDPSMEGAYALVELLDDSFEFDPHGDPEGAKVELGHTH